MSQHQLPDMEIPAEAVKNPVIHEWWQAFVSKPEHAFMWFLLVGLMLTFMSLMWTYHKNKGNHINIMDLVSVDGRLDESKLNRFIAFIISSWGFVWLLTTEKLSEWFFMGYMAAWVGNALFNRYLRIQDKRVDKEFEVEEKVVEKTGWRPTKRSYGRGMEIEPYDPEDDMEEPDLPPANVKGRRR